MNNDYAIVKKDFLSDELLKVLMISEELKIDPFKKINYLLEKFKLDRRTFEKYCHNVIPLDSDRIYSIYTVFCTIKKYPGSLSNFLTSFISSDVDIMKMKDAEFNDTIRLVLNIDFTNSKLGIENILDFAKINDDIIEIDYLIGEF